MAKIQKTNGKTTITLDENKPLRILQLTDLHLGGGLFSRKKDKMALSAVQKILNRANADFVVVTGDICYPFFIFSGTNNNLKGTKMFANFMEKSGIPWCMVFGNHDVEKHSRYSKEDLCDFYESLPNCHFRRGEPMTGQGNYSIPVFNSDGKLNTVLMFLDSNSYLSWHFFSGFDTIHQDQIDWYKNEISSFSEGSLPPSLAFFHIPPKEFKEGWDKCRMGSDEATYRSGFVQEKDNYFGYPKTIEGNFVKEMIEFGSLKGFFCGHDHLNTLSIDYLGMRMTYGMSIDYLAYHGIKKKTTQRGGTLISLFPDSSFEVTPLPLE